MKMQTFTKEQLEEVMSREGATPKQIQGVYLESVAKSLKTEPVRYRLFGAYWWLIKRQLIEKELVDDVNIDLLLFSKLTYNDDVFDLVSAWLYFNEQFDLYGLLANNNHQPLDGGDLGAFVIDEYMESRINNTTA